LIYCHVEDRTVTGLSPPSATKKIWSFSRVIVEFIVNVNTPPEPGLNGSTKLNSSVNLFFINTRHGVLVSPDELKLNDMVPFIVNVVLFVAAKCHLESVFGSNPPCGVLPLTFENGAL